MLAKSESDLTYPTPSNLKLHGATTFTQEMADLICDLIATHGETLDQLKERYGIPDKHTIYMWTQRHDHFMIAYARARMAQAQLFADEVIEISDESSMDTVIDEDGNKRCNNEWIARSRLRVDSRKWLASKLLPRVYGDKVQTEVTIVVKHEDALGALE